MQAENRPIGKKTADQWLKSLQDEAIGLTQCSTLGERVDFAREGRARQVPRHKTLSELDGDWDG